MKTQGPMLVIGLAVLGACGAAFALRSSPEEAAEKPIAGTPISGAPIAQPLPSPATSEDVEPDAKPPRELADTSQGPSAPRDLKPKGIVIKPKLAEDPPEKPKNPAGFSFDLLASYDYQEPKGGGSGIPDRVRNYEGQDVVLVGYMLPIDFEPSGQVKTFFLMKDLASCCFGGTPRLNEFVDIAVPNGVEARYYPYEPIRVRGQLRMGEARDAGRVSSLYRMKAVLVRPDEDD